MMLKLKSLHGGPHRLQNDLVPTTTTMHGHTNLVKHPGFLGCGFLSKAHQEHKKLGLGVGLPKASRQPNISKKLGLGWQQIGRGFVAPTGCAQSSSSHSFLPSRDYSSESRPEVVRRVISADADQVNGGQIPLEVWFTGFLSQLASSKLLGFHHTSSSPSLHMFFIRQIGWSCGIWWYACFRERRVHFCAFEGICKVLRISLWSSYTEMSLSVHGNCKFNDIPRFMVCGHTLI